MKDGNRFSSYSCGLVLFVSIRDPLQSEAERAPLRVGAKRELGSGNVLLQPTK
jgi:hypothetical protein